MLRGSSLKIHPHSVLYTSPPDWLVFHETTYTTCELVLNATQVDEEWLTELAPHFYTRNEVSHAATTMTMGEVARGDPAGSGREGPRRDDAAGGAAARAKRRAEAEAMAEADTDDDDEGGGGSGGGVAAMLGESLLKAQRFF